MESAKIWKPQRHQVHEERHKRDVRNFAKRQELYVNSESTSAFLGALRGLVVPLFESSRPGECPVQAGINSASFAGRNKNYHTIFRSARVGSGSRQKSALATPSVPLPIAGSSTSLPRDR